MAHGGFFLSVISAGLSLAAERQSVLVAGSSLLFQKNPRM
jgi:hypothetical protein